MIFTKLKGSGIEFLFKSDNKTSVIVKSTAGSDFTDRLICAQQKLSGFAEPVFSEVLSKCNSHASLKVCRKIALAEVEFLRGVTPCYVLLVVIINVCNDFLYVIHVFTALMPYVSVAGDRSIPCEMT